ncbi:MAG: alanine dehydrogenase [Anaerolineae bacterium]|nr:alanine dehydrogenase [Anaerolineae bacterium]
MNISVPKEIRASEYRVGLSPAGVKMLAELGHTCYVQHDAGSGAGFSDLDYERVGASIVYSAEEAYGRGDLILKVARPTDQEIDWIQPKSTLAGFLHLPSAKQTKVDTLLQNKVTTLAYEQIQLPDGSHPVLFPLSEIGGKMSAQIAARFLQNDAGGKGILLGGMPGVPPAEVVIIGAGVAGRYAAEAFFGMGSQLTVLDTDGPTLDKIHRKLPQVVTMFPTPTNLEKVVAYADVVITAVMIPGRPAPIILSRDMVKTMKSRSLILDISIDQGGCVETSRPTTHEKPTFIDQDVIHYCVPNIPGAVARTATHAFQNVAIPFIQEVAALGVDKAIKQSEAIAAGINTHKGEIQNLIRVEKS